MNEAMEPDEDRPGLGQFFCIFCDKYFIDQETLDLHKKQKPHKRRLKSLNEPPHTQVCDGNSSSYSSFIFTRILEIGHRCSKDRRIH
ncbi:unnamed protein product [Trichobilharzia regenti]|nr:unnamed protein product [Trichobilharzia regenti]